MIGGLSLPTVREPYFRGRLRHLKESGKRTLPTLLCSSLPMAAEFLAALIEGHASRTIREEQ